MDAHAHLISLGWAGPGHALDSRPYKQKGHRGLAYDPAKVGNTGTGLVKPLLISQRKARFGVGKKAHEPQAGNEWWLKGFESALGNIGKSESERSSGASTPVPTGYAGGKHSGLYSFFVKGQQMEGTMDPLEKTEKTTTQQSKKRKSDVLGEASDEEENAITTKDTRQKSRSKTTADFEQVGTYIAMRDKGEKRRQRGEKPSPVEEFEQVGAYLEARSEKKEKKSKKRKSEAVAGQQISDASTEAEGETTEGQSQPDKPLDRAETKEERRERRRQRREQKERRRVEAAAAAAVTPGLKRRSEPSTAEASAVDDYDDETTRRAERKKRRRKAENATGESSKG